ncbi:hypothetical protein H0H93_000771, partial [Arthromyces matolae]
LRGEYPNISVPDDYEHERPPIQEGVLRSLTAIDCYDDLKNLKPSLLDIPAIPTSTGKHLQEYYHELGEWEPKLVRYTYTGTFQRPHKCLEFQTAYPGVGPEHE